LAAHDLQAARRNQPTFPRWTFGKVRLRHRPGFGNSFRCSFRCGHDRSYGPPTWRRGPLSHRLRGRWEESRAWLARCEGSPLSDMAFHSEAEQRTGHARSTARRHRLRCCGCFPLYRQDVNCGVRRRLRKFSRIRAGRGRQRQSFEPMLKGADSEQEIVSTPAANGQERTRRHCGSMLGRHHQSAQGCGEFGGPNDAKSVAVPN